MTWARQNADVTLHDLFIDENSGGDIKGESLVLLRVDLTLEGWIVDVDDGEEEQEYSKIRKYWSKMCRF